MIFKRTNHKVNFTQYLGIIFLLLLGACSSQNNSSIEIIDTPSLPNNLPNIPDETEDPNLNKLSAPREIINRVSFGRKDPFLPAHTKTNKLFIPNSFKYHGQIVSKDILNAFVSYQERTGTIKPGDIGGETTDLLPDGWVMSKLNEITNEITLKYEDNSIDVRLFSSNN